MEVIMTLEKYFLLHYSKKSGTRNRNNRMGDIVITIKPDEIGTTDSIEKDACVRNDPVSTDDFGHINTRNVITSTSAAGDFCSSRTVHQIGFGDK